jgi:thiol-disulfide isomerase/thioredoxin
LLAKEVAQRYEGRVGFAVEDFGNSPLADRLGVKQYPAFFIDDVLVATPIDFFEWPGLPKGRYVPFKDQAGRDRFQQDLARMLDLRLANGRLEARPVDAAASGKAGAAPGPVSAASSLPALRLTDLGGASVALADFKGRVVLVEFWATWCPPCRTTLDWLGGLRAAHQDRLEVVGVAVESPEAEVREAAARLAGVRIVMGSPEITAAFGQVMAVPTLMLFDTEGRMASVFYGAPPDLHEKVGAAIRALLG